MIVWWMVVETYEINDFKSHKKIVSWDWNLIEFEKYAPSKSRPKNLKGACKKEKDFAANQFAFGSLPNTLFKKQSETFW